MMHPRSIDVTSLASHHIIALLPLVCAPLLITIFSQNAPTQSLLRVVNGILDESIERKRGEIPHVSLFPVISSKQIAWNAIVYLSLVVDDEYGPVLVSACCLLAKECCSRD
jgi:hypothetical protein